MNTMIGELFREFAGIPSVVEFGSPDWANNRVIAGLRKRGIAYASTDLPELEGLPPVLDVVTSPLAYFRLEGRISKKVCHLFAENLDCPLARFVV